MLAVKNSQSLSENEVDGPFDTCKERKITMTNSFIPSLEQVHALATANLVASTQRDIALQLAEASFSTLEAESNKRNSKGLNTTKAKRKEIIKIISKDEESEKIKKADTDVNTFESKALICSFKGCGRKFAWSTHLKYHEMTHTNNRQYECPNEKCGKSFFTAQNLKVHLRTHTGEKPFKCSHDGCDKSFTTAGNLRNHERIHTGEQPFVCDYDSCDKRFTEYSSLRKHKVTHTGDKPFECSICKKKFGQSGSRQMHLLRHQLDKEITDSLKKSKKKKINSHRAMKTNVCHSAETIEQAKSDAEKIKTTVSSQVVTMTNSLQVELSQSVNEQMAADTKEVHQQSHHLHQAESHNMIPYPALLSPNEFFTDEKPNEFMSQTQFFNDDEQSQNAVFNSGVLNSIEENQLEFFTPATHISLSDKEMSHLTYHHHSSHNDNSLSSDLSLHHPRPPHLSDNFFQPNQAFKLSHDDLINAADVYSSVHEQLQNSYFIANEEVLREEVISTDDRMVNIISPESHNMLGVPVEELDKHLSSNLGKDIVHETDANLLNWSVG